MLNEIIAQGLTFLHEQQITGLNCAEPSSYMVDLSSAPRSTAPLQEQDANSTPRRFDRLAYPVRYYFVDFSNAARVFKETSQPPTSAGNFKFQSLTAFRKDVQDCGAMFDQLLGDVGTLQVLISFLVLTLDMKVPQIASKFRSLIKAMTLGGFTADDSRRLFEALCRSLDARVFGSDTSPRSSITASQIERSHTLSHPIAPGRRSPAVSHPQLERNSSH